MVYIIKPPQKFRGNPLISIRISGYCLEINYTPAIPEESWGFRGATPGIPEDWEVESAFDVDEERFLDDPEIEKLVSKRMSEIQKALDEERLFI